MNIPTGIIGKAIKARRKEMRLTQAKLAETLGIEARYLQKIENGKNLPSINLFYRIIHVMNLSADAIFFGRSDSPSETRAALDRRLSECDERVLRALLATANALLEGN